MKITTLSIPRSLFAILLIPMLAGPLTGCAALRLAIFGPPEEEDFFIPEQETAYDQLMYAESLRRTIFPSTNQKTRAQQMDKVIEAYQRVEELFPNDQTATPRAKTVLGMLYAKTPHRKDDAMRYLREVEKKYPDDSWVLVRSLWYQGLLYDQSGRYEDAQAKYREVMDRFRTSSDPEEQNFARQARDRYNRVRPR